MFAVALAVCVSSAAIATVLHLQMMLRLRDAGLPVEWFMAFFGNLRLWRSYKVDAPARGWPIWPFYAYRVFLILFYVSAFALLINRDRLFAWLCGR